MTFFKPSKVLAENKNHNFFGVSQLMPDSPNRVRGLNDLFLGALTSNVGLVCGCQGSLTFSVVEEHSELPFNEIMPRGPGILSVRDA